MCELCLCRCRLFCAGPTRRPSLHFVTPPSTQIDATSDVDRYWVDMSISAAVPKMGSLVARQTIAVGISRCSKPRMCPVLPCLGLCCPVYQMLAALYQNFVVNGFSVEGDQLKRYEAGQSKLAGILGLDPAAKMKVRSSTGSGVFLRCVRFVDRVGTH